MLRFFVSRVGQTIAVLFTVSVIIFALMRLIFLSVNSGTALHQAEVIQGAARQDRHQSASSSPTSRRQWPSFSTVNEQKIHHKYVKGFQMIPAGLIDMHRVWLDR